MGPIRAQIPQWDKEAARLREAVESSDEVSIVRVLARFTNKQRKKLIKIYKENFNEVRKGVLIDSMCYQLLRCEKDIEKTLTRSVKGRYFCDCLLFWIQVRSQAEMEHKVKTIDPAARASNFDSRDH